MGNNLKQLKANLQALNDASLQDYIQKYGIKMSLNLSIIDN